MNTTTAPARPDAITQSVRALYETYPYPASDAPTLRLGFDARYVLSLGRLPRPAGRKRRVLDAGCGRGLGLIGAATLDPEADFLGVDLCRPALAEVRGQIQRRGLRNVRLAEVDLMTLEGLDVPEGGFDLVISSGVVHHLSDPELGLRKLGEVLAPHGILSFMVYGAAGREGIARVARSLDAWLDDAEPLPDRLGRARELVAAAADGDEPDGAWRDANAVPDAEFVDRYLHPNERAFEVPSLLELIDEAGLRFLRWADPGEWSVERWLPEGPTREAARGLPDPTRFALIEQLSRPGRLELYLCRPENGPRPLPPTASWEELLLAPHPEAQLEIGTRGLWGSTRVETVGYRLRGRERVDLGQGPLATAAWILSSQNRPFRAAALVGALTDQGIAPDEARRTVPELFARELLYAPHEVELERAPGPPVGGAKV